MNLVFCTPSFSLGGYEKVAVNYACGFAKLGHNVTIICGFKKGELLPLITDNIRIIEFKARFRTFIFPLIKLLKNEPIDILYVPYHSYTCLAVIAKLLSGNKKCVVYGSSHGYVKKRFLLDKLLGYVMKHAEVLTAVTHDLAKYDSSLFDIPLEKYTVLKNPVFYECQEILKEKHKWLGENKKYPVIVLSGRLAKDKNYDISLNILQNIQKTHQVKMIILGDGPEKKQLIAFAKDLGITDNVDFLGYVENPMGYIIQCDVFLHTATVEAFGNVIVEALYCDVPVITTSTSGPLEIIKHGKYGINIGDANDPRVIVNGANAIRTILDKKKVFIGLRNFAEQYTATKLENDFLRPYLRIKTADKNMFKEER